MMKISKHFNDFLWPLIVQPAIINAKDNLDDDFAKYVGLTCLSIANDNECKYRDELSSLYKRKKGWLKKIYFGFAEQYNEKLLDMHKIAAIICRSIIGCKPFSFDVSKANEYKEMNGKNKQLDWIIDNYFINYKVAVNAAIAITLYDLIDKLGMQSNSNEEHIIHVKEIIYKLLNDGFDLYQEKPLFLKSDHELYYKSLILNTAINDINKRDFDYLAFATSCFQLQQFEVIKCEYMRFLD